jgi:hypothetical protein
MNKKNRDYYCVCSADHSNIINSILLFYVGEGTAENSSTAAPAILENGYTSSISHFRGMS